MNGKKIKKRLVSTNELCEYLSVSRQTIHNWRKEPNFPLEVKSPPRYDIEKVIKWLNERTN